MKQPWFKHEWYADIQTPKISELESFVQLYFLFTLCIHAQ